MHFIGVNLGRSALGPSPSSAVAILDDSSQLLIDPVSFRHARELVGLLAGVPASELVIAVAAPRSVPDQAAENYSVRSCETEARRRFDRAPRRSPRPRCCTTAGPRSSSGTSTASPSSRRTPR